MLDRLDYVCAFSLFDVVKSLGGASGLHVHNEIYLRSRWPRAWEGGGGGEIETFAII